MSPLRYTGDDVDKSTSGRPSILGDAHRPAGDCERPEGGAACSREGWRGSTAILTGGGEAGSRGLAPGTWGAEHLGLACPGHETGSPRMINFPRSFAGQRGRKLWELVDSVAFHSPLEIPVSMIRKSYSGVDNDVVLCVGLDGHG